MDVGKRKGLIDWVNSLAIGEATESLRELSDGKHAWGIISMIDNEQFTECPETPEKCFSIVREFLEGLYQVSLEQKIDFESILKNGNEFEIGKICLLLMCASLVCEKHQYFMECAMTCDMRSQFEIHEMGSYVLKPDNTLLGIDASFYHVLTKPLEMKPGTPVEQQAYMMPQQTSTPQGTSGKLAVTPGVTPISGANAMEASGVPFETSFHASMNIFSRFISPRVGIPSSPMSPVQQMVQSPAIVGKIMLQQREQKIKRLQRDLSAEKQLRHDLETDLEQKIQTLDQKDKIIKENQIKCQNLQRQIRQLQDQVETQCSDNKTDDGSPKTVRIMELQSEIHKMRELNKHLEKENDELYGKLAKLKDPAAQVQMLKGKLTEYEKIVKHQEFEMAEMRVALDDQKDLLKQMTDENDGINKDLRRLTDIHHQNLEEWKRRDSGNRSNLEIGECLGEVMEKELKVQVDALQDSILNRNDCLKELKTQLVESQNQCDESKKLLASSQEQLNQCQLYVGELESKVSEKENIITTLNDNLKLSEQLVDTVQMKLRNKNEELEETEKCLSSQCDVLGRKIEELNNALQNSEQNTKSLQDDLQCSQVMVTDLKAKLRQSDECVRDLKLELATAHQQETQLRDLLNHTNQNFEQVQQELVSSQERESHLQNQLEGLQQECKLSLEKVKLQQDNMDRLNQELISVKSELADKLSYIEEIKQQLETSKDYGSSLAVDIQLKNQRIATLTTELNDLQERESSLKCHADKWEAKVTVLEQELCTLQEKCTKMDQTIEDLELKCNTVNRQLFASNEKEKLTNETLKSEKDKVFKLSKDLANMQQQEVMFKEEMALREKHVAERDKHFKDLVTAMEAEKKTLDGELIATQRFLLEKEEDLQKMRENIVELTKQIDQLQQDNASLKLELQNVCQKLSIAEELVRDKEKKLKLVDSKFEELMHRLDHNIKIYKSEKEKSAKILDELQSELVKVHSSEESLITENASLKKTVSTMEEQSASKNQQICTLEKKLSDLLQEASSKETKLNSMLHITQEEFKQQIQNTTLTNDELKTKLEEYGAKVSLLENALLQAREESVKENEKLKCHITAKEAELLERAEEIKEFKKNIEVLESDLNIKDNLLHESQLKYEKEKEKCSQIEYEVKKQIDVAQSRIQFLESQMEFSQQKWSEAETSLKKQLKDSVATQNNMAQELESTRYSLGGKNEHLTNLQDKVAHLKEALDASEMQSQQLQQSLSVMEHKVLALDEQLAEAQKNCQRKEMQLEEELVMKDDRIKSLEQQVEAISKEISVGSTEKISAVSELEKRIKITERQIEEKHFTIQNLKEKCRELYQTNQTLTEDLDAVQKEKHMLKEELDELQNKLMSHGNELKLAKEREESLREEIAIAKSANDLLQSEMSKLQAQATERELEFDSKLLKVNEDMKAERQRYEEKLALFNNDQEKLHLQAMETEAVYQQNMQQAQVHCDHVSASLQLSSETYQKQTEKLACTIQENQRLVGQVEQGAKEIAQLKEALEQVEIRSTKEQEKLKKEVDRRMEMLEALQKEVEALKQSRDDNDRDKEEKLESLYEKLNELREAGCEKESIIEQLEEELNQVLLKYALLKADYELSQAQLETMDREMSEVTSKMKSREECVRKLEEIHRGLRKDLAEVHLAKDALSERKEEKQQEYINICAKAAKYEEQCNRLRMEVQMYKEQEQKLIATHAREIRQTSDMNKRLQNKLMNMQEKNKALMEELDTVKEQQSLSKETFAEETQQLRKKLESICQSYNEQLNDSEERYNKKLEAEVAKWQEKIESLNEIVLKTNEKLEETQRENQNIKEIAEQYKSYHEVNNDQINRMSIVEKETEEKITNYEKKMQQMSEEIDELKGKLQEELSINKRLSSQVKILEAQVNLANCKIKEQELHLNDVVNCYTKNNSTETGQHSPSLANSENIFKRPSNVKMANKRENKYGRSKIETTFDATTTYTESTEPIHAAVSMYDLRSKSPRLSPSQLSFKGLTVSQTKESRQRCPSTSKSESMIFHPVKKGPESLFGNSQDHLDVKASHLSKSTSSTSTKPARLSNVPGGLGALFSMEDEPDEACMWDRLSELQRRNTLCLPHMKSSYPVELEVKKKEAVSERQVKDTIPETGAYTMVYDHHVTRRNSRKRSSSDLLNDSLDESITSYKQETKRKPPQEFSQWPSTPGVKLYKHYSPSTTPNNNVGTRATNRRLTPKTPKTPKTPVSERITRQKGRRTPACKSPTKKRDVENEPVHSSKKKPLKDSNRK